VELEPLYRDHIDRLHAAYAGIFEQTGWDAVFLHSGTPALKSPFDDQYWPMRPTPHFQHWIALEQPDCGLLIRPGQRPTLYRNVHVSFWETAPALAGSHFLSSFEVVDVDGPDDLGRVCPRTDKIAFIGADRTRAARWGFADSAIVPDELSRRLDELRSRKSEYERACLAEANRRAARGHQVVLARFAAEQCSELELHLAYLEATLQDDPETPYKNVLAVGAHAATLHHVNYDRQPTAGPTSLLIDAGATCHGYHSDITRTAVKGQSAAADLFRGLIAQLEDLQQEMCRRVQVGVPYQDLHNQAHELLAQVLVDVGIGTASAEALVAHGVTRTFLPHGLGHSLGLQTHDVGCAVVRPEPQNPFLRNTSDVAVGQVFTIEPGCYFIGPLLNQLRASEHSATVNWQIVAQLSPFGGVRIEDDIAVVDGGIRNLTREVL
jgi:Xaa-Pro dipeptidase